MTEIPSVIGRLIEELSWTGSTIKDLRGGGRGYENVLTVEVLQALDFLPRREFLGSLVDALNGGDSETRHSLRNEVEEANFLVLPGSMDLQGNRIPKVEVQPDAIITTPHVRCLIEAKRIRSSQFQAHQLAREFVMAHRDADGRRPMLLLLISNPPPVKVQKRGKLSIGDAIVAALPEVFQPGTDLSEWTELIDTTVSWITWNQLAKVVEAAATRFSSGSPSVDASVHRVANSILRSISWHGPEPVAPVNE